MKKKTTALPIFITLFAFYVLIPNVTLAQTKTRLQIERNIAMKNLAQSMMEVGKATNVEQSKAPANSILSNARKLQNMWPISSGGSATRARENIWNNYKDFNSKLLNMLTVADLLAKASQQKNLNLVKTRFVDVGNSCKGCHRIYRSPKKW